MTIIHTLFDTHTCMNSFFHLTVSLGLHPAKRLWINDNNFDEQYPHSWNWCLQTNRSTSYCLQCFNSVFSVECQEEHPTCKNYSVVRCCLEWDANDLHMVKHHPIISCFMKSLHWFTFLVLNTNRKSYVAYQTAPLPMTLNDLKGHFC